MGLAGGMGLLFGFFPIVYCVREGDEINTKSRGGGCRLRLGVDGDADCRKTGFPPCRLRHPPRRYRKRPLAVQKVRLSPVEKQLLIGAPLQTLPNGLGFLCRALALLWQFLTWSVRVGNGASGWGKNKKGTPLSPNLC